MRHWSGTGWPVLRPLGRQVPRSPSLGRHHSDRGSATVWSLGAIAVLCVVFGAVLALGQAVAVRHRAAGAADLAALAAADHWAEGGAGACGRAERVAAAQGARLARCAIVGETSDVTAGAGRGLFAAEVRARAGPAGPVRPVPPVPVPVSPASAGGPISVPSPADCCRAPAGSWLGSRRHQLRMRSAPGTEVGFRPPRPPTRPPTRPPARAPARAPARPPARPSARSPAALPAVLPASPPAPRATAP